MSDRQVPTPRYWCHQCTRAVQPTRGEGEIRCPDCNTGFVQELEGDVDAAERAASLWYSMLFDMLERSNHHQRPPGSGSGTGETDRVEPFSGERRPERSVELLLRLLVESEASRSGTPPAQKEAVEGLPTVKVGERSSCPVCLEEMEVGSEAKEMPCRHRFHVGCIVPWLEIHGTCPVCRLELKADASRGSSSGGGVGVREGRRRRHRFPSWLAAIFSGQSRRRRRRSEISLTASRSF